MPDEKKTGMVVARQSNGEQVRLELSRVSRPQGIVVISIPAYNCRLTFMATTKWVKLVSREKMDSDRKGATLHVSKSVWNRAGKGAALWAAGILHDPRLVPEQDDGVGSIALEEALRLPGPKKQEAGCQFWIIFWSATYADFPKVLIRAASETDALRQARRIPELGTFTVVSDWLFARPVGTNRARAQAEMARREKEALAAQERALHPSPEEIRQREEAGRQLHEAAAELKAQPFRQPRSLFGQINF